MFRSAFDVLFVDDDVEELMSELMMNVLNDDATTRSGDELSSASLLIARWVDWHRISRSGQKEVRTLKTAKSAAMSALGVIDSSGVFVLTKIFRCNFCYLTGLHISRQKGRTQSRFRRAAASTVGCRDPAPTEDYATVSHVGNKEGVHERSQVSARMHGGK